ncbi:BTB/POZ domain-containing protein 3-like [Contarinia nasturtii]|uniref:BTB/POZ domain-containing protein 3-like n=1 Tax=Contarinia nasturtii TaxID=265458 RepID=UPI0012D3A9F1|nr:BTB/POZ domain-containing protein 3-like [Contarinia nasturtii]
MSTSKVATTDIASHILSQIGKKFYLSKEFADVYFVYMVNDEEVDRDPAHKNLLAASSDVFHTMFNESWKEKNEVKIVDAAVADFKEFLRFFYFGTVNLTIENVDKIMNLSNKYNVTECKNLCREFLKTILTSENVLWAYDLAVFLEDENLKKFCEAIISINARDLLKTQGFFQCNQNRLMELMEIKSLKCSEAELLGACISWVKNKSKEENLTTEIIQSLIGDLFSKIRFGSMTLNEFVTLIPSYGELFPKEVLQDIIQMKADKEFQSKIFSGIREKRSDVEIYVGNKIYCNRENSGFNSGEYLIKDIETTTFSVSETVFLKNFECDNLLKWNGDYCDLEELVPTEITIVEMQNLEHLPNNEEAVLYKGNTNLRGEQFAQVSLPNPILIKVGFIYKIQLKQTPPADCILGTSLKSRVQIDSDFIVQFHHDTFLEQDPYSARGLIVSLDFYRI